MLNRSIVQAVHKARMKTAIEKAGERGLRGGRNTFIQMNDAGYQRRALPSALPTPTDRISPYVPDRGAPVRFSRDAQPPYMDNLMADQQLLGLL